jgi:ATP-dependent 26S proteasome regulatory subunit
MNEEQTNSPLELTRAQLRRADPDQVFAAITGLLEQGMEVEQVTAKVGRLRQNGGPELSEKLDCFLLARIAGFTRQSKHLQGILAELKHKLGELMQPPYFVARYLGPVTTPDGVFAAVSEEGQHRVIAFAEGLSADALRVGQEVLLAQGRNALIGQPLVSRTIHGETASVARVTEDGRVVLGDRDVEVVVSTADELPAASLKPGDRLIWDRSARIALSRLEASDAVALGYEDIEGATEQHLGGMDSLRESVLARFVYSILHPDIANRYQVSADSNRRLLLMGPPGTGKTTLMRIIAGRIADATRQKCRIVSVSGAELYSAFVGETERKINDAFTRLHEYEGPGLLFFDEIDAIARIRDGNPSAVHDERFLGTLLAALEGVKKSNVAVVAATNRASVLDPALRDRFAWELEMPRPGMDASRQIFAIHLPPSLPYRPNSDEAPVTRQALIDAGVSSLYDPNAENKIASLQFRDGKQREVSARELVSGRLIEQICGTARAAAFERECRGGEAGISIEDIRCAALSTIERLRSTLSIRNVSSYLTDLPQDVDVVSVTPIRPRIEQQFYVREAQSAE